MTQLLRGAPRDFQKLGSISALAGIDWAKIPTYYFDVSRFDFPLTDTEFNTRFGTTIPVFNVDGEPDPNRDSNAAVGSGVNEPFVALGTGVVAIGESEAFALHGASFVRGTATIATPATLVSGASSNESYTGVVDLQQSAAGGRHAVLWWGAPTWRFIEKFFEAYRLQITMGNRFEIVNESLLDVGMTPTPAEFVGTSDSRIATTPFIRQVNDVLREKSASQLFVPANNFLITDNNENTTSHSLPPADSGVTYGHPRIIGLANRFYCFDTPILFLPGMRFAVSFQRAQNEDSFGALRRTSTVNAATYDNTLTGSIAGLANGAEITTIPGGSVTLGIVFKGFALHPKAVIEYLTKHVVKNTMTACMYENVPYLGQMMKDSSLGMSSEVSNLLGLLPKSVSWK